MLQNGQNKSFPSSDFMDALCDPRAFLSAQEKRAEQLKALGIEETDISGDVIESKGKGDKEGDKGGKDGAKPGAKKEEKKGKNICYVKFAKRLIMIHFVEEFSLEPITCDSLRSEKGFLKATKKHTKEFESMQKKLKKERESILSNQCKAIEKLMKTKK